MHPKSKNSYRTVTYNIVYSVHHKYIKRTENGNDFVLIFSVDGHEVNSDFSNLTIHSIEFEGFVFNELDYLHQQPQPYKQQILEQFKTAYDSIPLVEGLSIKVNQSSRTKHVIKEVNHD